jgi:hypothetical protein
MTEIPRSSEAMKPTPIFAHKEKQVINEVGKVSLEFTTAVNKLIATHGLESGQHAVAFLKGFNELLAGLTSLSSEVEITDILAGVALNLENEVEDTLAIYIEKHDE